MTDAAREALSAAVELAESNVITPPTLPVLPDGTLAPLNLGDTIVQEIVTMMRAGQWNGRKSCDEIALRYGVTRGSAEHYASEAGRYLRIDGAPDGMLAWMITRLQAIVEENDKDRVLAIKTLADMLMTMASRRGNRPQGPGGDKLSAMRSLLRNPPPELVELLTTEWGPRTVAATVSQGD